MSMSGKLFVYQPTNTHTMTGKEISCELAIKPVVIHIKDNGKQAISSYSIKTKTILCEVNVIGFQITSFKVIVIASFG